MSFLLALGAVCAQVGSIFFFMAVGSIMAKKEPAQDNVMWAGFICSLLAISLAYAAGRTS
jgi:hypothetical protein